MDKKSPDAFRTISEVADWLGVPTHVLRFWESRFTQVKPVKRAGGRRYYRPGDMELLGGIRRLLHVDGLTIRGVQKLLRENGVKHVAAMSPPLDSDEMREDVPSNVVPLGRKEDNAETQDAVAHTPEENNAVEETVAAAEVVADDARALAADDVDVKDPAPQTTTTVDAGAAPEMNEVSAHAEDDIAPETTVSEPEAPTFLGDALQETATADSMGVDGTDAASDITPDARLEAPAGSPVETEETQISQEDTPLEALSSNPEPEPPVAPEGDLFAQTAMEAPAVDDTAAVPAEVFDETPDVLAQEPVGLDALPDSPNPEPVPDVAEDTVVTNDAATAQPIDISHVPEDPSDEGLGPQSLAARIRAKNPSAPGTNVPALQALADRLDALRTQMDRASKR